MQRVQRLLQRPDVQGIGRHELGDPGAHLATVVLDVAGRALSSKQPVRFGIEDALLGVGVGKQDLGQE